jgi:hypothetical protein
MKIEFRNKTDGTLALTLALSPEERGQQANILSFSNAHSANPASRSARRRDAIHPLLGERAGVRENVAPFVTILLAIAFHLAAAFGVHAQSYSIDWYKVSGGGGTSTGGVYSVSGTIGQHDAGGLMTGGNFSLTGGFWSLYAVQTPGAPMLNIQLTTTNTAMVYWPSPSAGYNLQVNTNLATTNWTTPSETVTDNGTIKYILVNPPTGNRFYRLKNP